MLNDYDELEKRIKAVTAEKAEKSDLAKNLNAGAEFIGPILGGLFIGYGLDSWLDTKPIFIISLFLLGFAAGIVNIYKASQNIGSSIGFSELHHKEKEAKNAPNETESD